MILQSVLPPGGCYLNSLEYPINSYSYRFTLCFAEMVIEMSS